MTACGESQEESRIPIMLAYASEALKHQSRHLELVAGMLFQVGRTTNTMKEGYTDWTYLHISFATLMK